MSTAPRRPCAAQARIGFQTSIDAVQMWTPSMNSVAGVNQSHKRILRDRISNDYNGEPVQLMTRDAPSLLPSPRLEANSTTSAMLPGLDVRNELSKYSQRRIVSLTLGPD
jgi:hypothetical protein